MITLEIYGVKNIVGIPFGYRGFGKELAEMPVSFFFLLYKHLLVPEALTFLIIRMITCP